MPIAHPPEMEALVIKTRKENYDDACLSCPYPLNDKVFQIVPVSVPLIISFIGTAYSPLTPVSTSTLIHVSKKKLLTTWQTDPSVTCLENQRRRHPLMVMDDHSWSELKPHAQYGETFGDTIPVMRKYFGIWYAKGNSVRQWQSMGNGPYSTGFTKYEGG